MGKYFLTAKALSDLSDIYEYTYYFWSENQADKYYQNLIDCFHSLAKIPRIGRAYDEIDLGLLGFPMRKHVIFDSDN